ncbi:PREDICTED: naringenin 8-dimethylallyltransferase 2, chloroplastic-like [Lupinus angustifolius]|uniref:naringenin 8-dimethylallyltransferase 2, chloroplastic-like n=1 Tax=Lupinus angustifolius TaxID=3871 RepID=UPI00092E4A59|nr:PREDICTED: naringenin 8-dimethylallyltransferase 2, chloroplastic-like [Lupinus angustifolius]
MNVMIASSFTIASSITTGGNRQRSKQCAKTYYSSSYVQTLWHKTGKIQKKHCAMMSSNSLQHRCKVIEDGFKCQQWKRKCTINAISDGQSIEPESQAPDKKSMKDSVKDGLVALYQFTRPYSAIPIVLEATSMSLLAVEKSSDLSLLFFKGWLQTVVASVLMIIVNCGLNELCDLEIDKINKPHLPLTSGALSIEAGIAIVAASAFLGLWLSWMSGSWPLFCNVLYNNVLAVVYSVDLPLLRWKKSSFLTAIYILTNIGVVIPIGSFLHIQTHVFKRAATFPRSMLLSTTVLSIFCIVISMIKDIPDMEGDEKYGIKSLTLRLGQKQVFSICISLLNMAYGVGILVGATSPYLWSKISVVLGHATLALVLQYRAKSVDPKNKDSVQSFYMFIWKQLFTAECLLLPLFRS